MFYKLKFLIRVLKPILGIIICAFIILPWFFAIEEATQGVFLQKAFNEDFFNKLQSGQEGHGALPGTHLLILSIAILQLSSLLGCPDPIPTVDCSLANTIALDFT